MRVQLHAILAALNSVCCTACEPGQPGRPGPPQLLSECCSLCCSLISPPLCCSMAEADGLCSLVLRSPCQWEGALYNAVGPVLPVSLTSVLSANETLEAWGAVGAYFGWAPPPPPPSPAAQPPPLSRSPAAKAPPPRGNSSADTMPNVPAVGDGTYNGGCAVAFAGRKLLCCCMAVLLRGMFAPAGRPARAAAVLVQQGTLVYPGAASDVTCSCNAVS